MSSSTPSRHEADVDPSKTAKFLANLQRTVGRRDPDDAPISFNPAVATTSQPSIAKPAPTLPVHAEVPEPVRSQPTSSSAEPTMTPIPQAVSNPAGQGGSRSAKPRRRSENKADKMQLEVTLDPGTASRVVYIRVDKTLADRLALIAFQNKINGGDGPATINDIGISALNRWLDDYEQAA